MNSKGIHRKPSLAIKLHIALLLALGFVPALACQQDSTPHRETVVTPYADKDAYLIYAMLLESTESPSPVIQAETESWSAATDEGTGIRGNKAFVKVWGIALRDFARQYRNPRLLTQTVPIEAAYELVSKQKVLDGGWDMFYKLHPSSGGFFTFSAVGFDSQKTHAIVQMNHRCGLLCGYGKPHFFEKKDGKWREVSVDASVTVWVS